MDYLILSIVIFFGIFAFFDFLDLKAEIYEIKEKIRKLENNQKTLELWTTNLIKERKTKKKR